MGFQLSLENKDIPPPKKKNKAKRLQSVKATWQNWKEVANWISRGSEFPLFWSKDFLLKLPVSLSNRDGHLLAVRIIDALTTFSVLVYLETKRKGPRKDMSVSQALTPPGSWATSGSPGPLPEVSLLPKDLWHSCVMSREERKTFLLCSAPIAPFW